MNICDEKFLPFFVKMLDPNENRTSDSNNQDSIEPQTFEENKNEEFPMLKDEKESISSDYSNQGNNLETSNINKDNRCHEVSVKNCSSEVIIIGEDNECKLDLNESNSQSNLGIQEKSDSQEKNNNVNNSIQHDDNSDLNSKLTQRKKFNEKNTKKSSLCKDKRKKELNREDKNKRALFVAKLIGHKLKRGKKKEEKKIKKEKKPIQKERKKYYRYELERKTLRSCVHSGHNHIIIHLSENLKKKGKMKEIFWDPVLPSKYITSEDNLLININKTIEELYKDSMKGNFTSESIAHNREIIDNICKNAEKEENDPDLKNLKTYFCLKIKDLLKIYIDKDELDNYDQEVKELFNDYKIKHMKDEFIYEEEKYYKKRVKVMKDLIKKSSLKDINKKKHIIDIKK